MSNERKKPFERLPKNVVPVLYNITLKPDLSDGTITGLECIHVKIVTPTDKFVLNSAEIVISEATFSKTVDGSVIQGSVSYDVDEERAIIAFDKTIESGEGYLRLVFTGILNDKMAGFYRTRYRSAVTNQDDYFAATQFAPTDGRRAFPCWDEPDIKARFQVKMIVPKDRKVVCNTNVVEEETDPFDKKMKIVTFQPSPIMSTYLVAIIVGEYDEVKSTTSRGVKVRVLTPVGRKENGTFALADAIKYVEYFENYFNINYPLEKLDHIAAPNFAYNAMENWGLIIYRETALLIDNENSSCSAKQHVAQVVAHETAHQWFGNLVTMEWWTHLWLNEGFATFMQYLAVESHHPEYEFWKQFASSSSITALELDASHKSHPIEVPVGAPDEINSIFDHISYHKGAAMIRMCHDWIGDQAFRVGMKDYLETHAYSNATTEHLWTALEKASKKPVSKVMPIWTSQMGYPLITVSIASESDSSVILNLKQEKFVIDGKLSKSEAEMLWTILVSVVNSNDPKEVKKFDLFDGRSTQITLDSFSLKNGSWFKLNPSLYGFYRVNYPTSVWHALGQAVKDKALGPVDRLQLIDDITALNLAGMVPIDEVMKMLENYADEDDYVSWTGVDKCLKCLDLLISYTDCYQAFQKFAIRLVSKAYQKLGFDERPDEANTIKMMRALVVSRLVSLQDKEIISEAQKRFQAHLKGQSLFPELREPVYKAMVKSGGDEIYDTLLKLYHQTELQEEKVRIAVSLGALSDEKRIQQTLDFAVSEHVRPQNSWQVLLAVSETPKGRQAAWNFYKKNIEEMKKRYGSHRSSARLIEGLTEKFASEEMAQQVTTFYTNNVFLGLENVALRAVEKVRLNDAWLNREVDFLRDYLQTVSL